MTAEPGNLLLEETAGASPDVHLAARKQRREKHSHYFKPCPFGEIDVYRVLHLFNVTDPCLQHAIKKVLVAGGRGHKDITKDIQEAIDTLRRWQEMRMEERESAK